MERSNHSPPDGNNRIHSRTGDGSHANMRGPHVPVSLSLILYHQPSDQTEEIQARRFGMWTTFNFEERKNFKRDVAITISDTPG